MPRGTRVSIDERRGWLEDYEKGMPLAGIAAKWHRDPGSITRSLERARQERAMGRVLEGRLEAAAQAHDEDLLNAAQELANSLRSLPSGHNIAFSRRTQLLLDGLRQHDPRNSLWKAHEATVALRSTILESDVELRDTVKKAVADERRRIALTR